MPGIWVEECAGKQGRLAMLIDFADAHRQYLVGFAGDNGWEFTPVNPSNHEAGRYFASHQIFSSHALGLALCIRNGVSREGVATSASAGLKLSFSHRHRGNYLLNKDQNKITLTLGINGAGSLYSWLRGRSPTFNHEIVRPNAPPKLLTGFELKGGQFDKIIRATQYGDTGEATLIEVGLSQEHIFHLQMYCIGLGRLLYPSISDAAIMEHLVCMTGVPPEAGTPDAEPPSARAEDPGNALLGGQSADYESVGGQALLAPSSTDAGLARQRKAIYAVGVSKWPAKRKDVITYIQDSGTPDGLNRLIQEGNAGDFSGWDRLAQLFDNSR